VRAEGGGIIDNNKTGICGNFCGKYRESAEQGKKGEMRDGRVTGWVEYFLYQATVNSVPMKEIINFFYF